MTIYVTNCPKCHETVTFLNGEDTKICRNCGEVVFNTKSSNYKKPLKEEDDASGCNDFGD
jgi:rRNA maturation endonuclease Nob1